MAETQVGRADGLARNRCAPGHFNSLAVAVEMLTAQWLREITAYQIVDNVTMDRSTLPVTLKKRALISGRIIAAAIVPPWSSAESSSGKFVRSK